jgi:hypothetical protein
MVYTSEQISNMTNALAAALATCTFVSPPLKQDVTSIHGPSTIHSAVHL